jgi:hypothetical protein
VSDSCPIRLDHGVIGAPTSRRDRAFSPEVGYFTQVLNGRLPDASTLLLPMLGIIDPRDRRFVSTLCCSATYRRPAPTWVINTAVTISALIGAREMRFRAGS